MNEIVGQPTVSFGQSPKRSSGRSSGVQRHQPGTRQTPNNLKSNAVNAITTIAIKVTSEITAARWRKKRLRTIWPWLKPSISLFWIAFSPDRTSVDSTLAFDLRAIVMHHFLLEYEGLKLSTVNLRQS